MCTKVQRGSISHEIIDRDLHELHSRPTPLINKLEHWYFHEYFKSDGVFTALSSATCSFRFCKSHNFGLGLCNAQGYRIIPFMLSLHSNRFIYSLESQYMLSPSPTSTFATAALRSLPIASGPEPTISAAPPISIDRSLKSSTISATDG